MYLIIETSELFSNKNGRAYGFMCYSVGITISISMALEEGKLYSLVEVSGMMKICLFSFHGNQNQTKRLL